MGINAEKLQNVLHTITEWVPITSEEVKTEIHTLIEDLVDGANTEISSSVAPTDITTASNAAPVSNFPSVQEIASAVKSELDPTLNSIHDSMSAIEYNLAQNSPPTQTSETVTAPETPATVETPTDPPTGVPS